MKISPRDVAEFVEKDSRALQDVALDAILYELKIRGIESNSLTRQKVIDELASMLTDLKAKDQE